MEQHNKKMKRCGCKYACIPLDGLAKDVEAERHMHCWGGGGDEIWIGRGNVSSKPVDNFLPL